MRKDNYSVSLLSAISQEKVVASQLIEGGIDSSLFENFIAEMLQGLRQQPEYENKNIVLLMDNARIHHHQMVLATARRMKVNVLFSSEYSPWLNPIESLFAHLKRKNKESQISIR